MLEYFGNLTNKPGNRSIFQQTRFAVLGQPRAFYDQCMDDLINLIPTPERLIELFSSFFISPVDLVYTNIKRNLIESYQPKLQPYCRSLIQLQFDVLFEKLAEYEFGNIPILAFFPGAKFKFGTYYNRMLDVIKFNEDNLPGLKMYADEINSKNLEAPSDVFVSVHSFITGTIMIEENIKRRHQESIKWQQKGLLSDKMKKILES